MILEEKRRNTDMLNESYRILLVEDDHYVAQLMISIFDYMDLFVDHATSTEKALSYFETHNYNLAIFDIHLGTDNGLDLAEKMKMERPDLEIITMTGDNPKSVEKRVRELRVLYHFVKPFEFKELTTVIRHTLNKNSKKSVLFDQ